MSRIWICLTHRSVLYFSFLGQHNARKKLAPKLGLKILKLFFNMMLTHVEAPPPDDVPVPKVSDPARQLGRLAPCQGQPYRPALPQRG